MPSIDLHDEDRFRTCLESLLDGLVLLTAVRSPSGTIADFRCDFINEAGCRLNQRPREDLLGRMMRDLWPGHREALFEGYRQVVETGEPMARETLFYEGDGSRRLKRAIDLRAVRLGDGLAVTWRDTTDRCHAEASVREQEFRFRAIFENSSEAILLTRPDGGILAANPAACRLTGFSEAEICAGGRERLVDPADPGLPTLVERRRRTGFARGELAFKRADGGRFPAEVASSMFTDMAGNALTVILFRDLSPQRRLEARSRRLAALVASADDAIYTADFEGRITDWNEGATVLYGYTAEEAIGQPPSLIVPEDLLADSGALLTRLRAGERFRHHETLRRRKDGTLVHVSISASPILLPDGSLGGISVIARDITARVEAAAERERLIRDLQAALADVKTLSGLVPICSWCKRIRDDQGYWTQLEHYIQDRSSAQFTHGICPRCAAEFHPDAAAEDAAH